MKVRKLTAIALSVCMVFGLMACGGDETQSSVEGGNSAAQSSQTEVIASQESAERDNSGAGSGAKSEPEAQTEAVIAGSGPDGTVMLRRSVRTDRTPMGEDGSWTVFVYLCGSDMEPGNGMGTRDMQEMASSAAGGNVRFVVETGGSTEWMSDVNADALDRFVIADGKITKVDSLGADSMGKGETLTSFLKWGVQNYAAANMAFILWDHGSGSINGVCFDSNYDDDALLLKEIDAALYNVRDAMTDSFRFIGFDACLMSTVETASVLMPHADYMIASQETEPYVGWDYKVLGDYLAAHPMADTVEVGKAICDSYYDACDYDESQNIATLSVTDLASLSPLLTTFETYSQDIYSLTDSVENFTEVARKITSGDNFGGNNRREGYTNMVDMGSVIQAGEGYSEHVSEAASALREAVVYKVNGTDHADASGLSIYYPLSIQGSSELTIFRDVCVSTSYMGLVDKIAYGYANGTIAEYQNDAYEDGDLIDWFMSILFYDEDLGEYYYDEDGMPSETDWDFLDDYAGEGMSTAISFDEEPDFDEDGYYGFTLSDEGLANAASVEAYVLQVSDEDDELIDLGITADVYVDYDTGEVSDNFDGYWFCLPDGQVLEVYIVEQCDGFDIYTSPIELNGEETNLRFVHDYETGEVEWAGVWDGIDENGIASRDVEALEDGDEIVPLYYCYDYDFEELDEYYYGDTYTYSDGDEMGFELLWDGDYVYGFYINDIYGDYYTTDFVLFTIEDGEVYFED